jgi:uncharacterized protein involved in high-affinity Fe2+ transport
MSRPVRLSLSCVGALLWGLAAAHAAEYPVGSPHIVSGMEIAAVYLQPVEMDPPDMMLAAADADIHLEADIHATADNRNGFAEGDWLPNLHVEYLLVRLDTGEQISGALMPMVASDGPHYGDNVRLAGMGNYRLTFTVHSEPHGDMGFGRHVDKETGVAEWPGEIVADYDFTFAGLGKLGGY